jgi:hypothetical protein
MKKIFAVITLALAFVVTAFSQTVDGPTATQRSGGQVLVSNTGSTYVNVRFVQPSFEVTLVLAPGEARLVGNNEAYWEWTCVTGTATIPGTNYAPSYAYHGQNMDCR